MAGTIDGGLGAAATNKRLYGEDYYKRIGAKGGSAPSARRGDNGKQLKGFAVSGLAREAGRRGGTLSRRYAPKRCTERLHVVFSDDNQCECGFGKFTTA